MRRRRQETDTLLALTASDLVGPIHTLKYNCVKLHSALQHKPLTERNVIDAFSWPIFTSEIARAFSELRKQLHHLPLPLALQVKHIEQVTQDVQNSVNHALQMKDFNAFGTAPESSTMILESAGIVQELLAEAVPSMEQLHDTLSRLASKTSRKWRNSLR